MELKEFVSETLTQICEGVKDAQQRCANVGARINPPINSMGTVCEKNMTDQWAPTKVMFKAALQTSDKTNGKSGIGVLLANVTIGATKENLQDFSSVTSVEFSVPVVFPVSR